MKKEIVTFKGSLNFSGIRILKIPATILAIVIVVSIILVKTLLGLINNQKTALVKAKSDNEALTRKEAILKSIDSGIIQKAGYFSYALPDASPVLSIFSQLKISASERGLFLENLKAGSDVKDKQLNRVDITYEIQGETSAVLDSLKETVNFAPIVSIQKVRFTKQADNVRATVGLRGFWSPFPKTIPALTQVQPDFTKDDLVLIETISGLKQPQFLILIPNQNIYEQTQTIGKTDPFF